MKKRHVLHRQITAGLKRRGTNLLGFALMQARDQLTTPSETI